MPHSSTVCRDWLPRVPSACRYRTSSPHAYSLQAWSSGWADTLMTALSAYRTMMISEVGDEETSALSVDLGLDEGQSEGYCRTTEIRQVFNVS